MLLASVVKKTEKITRGTNEQQMRQNTELRLAKYNYVHTFEKGEKERDRSNYRQTLG